MTGVALFLQGCCLYLVFLTVAALLDQPATVLPFGLVLLALVWSFVIMSYMLTLNVDPRMRGLLGLASALPSLLILTNMNTGAGLVPVQTLASGDLESTVAVIGTVLFLMIVWWRGGEVAKEYVTLDVVRSAFMMGLGVLFVTAIVDSMVDERLVSGFLVLGFFAVGLVGLSLARFSSDTGETHFMSREWVMPILVSVAAVVLLGLAISAIGLGGLDDVSRDILAFVARSGFWVLRPVLLLMGLVVSLLVGIGNWVSGAFGGGDLTALDDARSSLDEFHRRLREANHDEETSTVLFTLLKWLAFTVAAVIGGYVLYRLFRFRRFKDQESDVEETRESLFTWRRANDDLSDMFGAWWMKIFPIQERRSDGGREPVTPREFYHGFLGLAARLGRPRRDSETPNEHQRGLWGLLPTDPVYRIVQRFQRSHYGRNEPDDAGLEDLREDWKVLNEFVDQEDREAT